MTEVVRDAVRGDERAPVRLQLVQEHPWRVEADGPTGPLVAEADDLFTALVHLREQLEPAGWLLQVNGARVDAYPSRMALDSGGRQVYVLRSGHHARGEDLVDTLGPLEDGRAGTVAEQRENFDRWRQDVARS